MSAAPIWTIAAPTAICKMWRKSRQLARQWLREARDDFEFDPQTIGELISAFETWARREQAYGEALYDFNLSVARLEKAAGGVELIPRDDTTP